MAELEVLKNAHSQALNFLAHISSRGGIVLFVARQPHLVQAVEATAKGQHSYDVRKCMPPPIVLTMSLSASSLDTSPPFM